MTAPARYFPVKPAPLRMRPGLFPFGTGFGNGPRDELYFQADAQLSSYVAAKRRVSASWTGGALVNQAPEHARELLAGVQRWCARQELGGEPSPPSSLEPVAWLNGLAMGVQEDLVVLQRTGTSSQGAQDGDSVVYAHVCFPSGWRPESILGLGFQGIHRPVPGFAKSPRMASGMVKTMIERGPHVRFVWTLSHDPALDHHPDHGERLPWPDELPQRAGVYLRVERQVTVPFSEHSGALFLIRTYVYPAAELGSGQLAILAKAMELMPTDVASYKGLEAPRTMLVGWLKQAAQLA